MFQKRHYEAIARALYRTRDGTTDDMIEAISDVFINDNPYFSAYWFDNAVRTGDMGKPK